MFFDDNWFESETILNSFGFVGLASVVGGWVGGGLLKASLLLWLGSVVVEFASKPLRNFSMSGVG